MNRRLHLFALPTLVAAISVAGLIAGLLGDGGYDVIAVALLAVPVAIIAWSLITARRGGWDR